MWKIKHVEKDEEELVINEDTLVYVAIEDDGKSFDYKEGGFAQWQLAYSDGFLSRLMGGHYKTSRRYFLQKPDGSKIPVQL
jgi:hypothetical protein